MKNTIKLLPILLFFLLTTACEDDVELTGNARLYFDGTSNTQRVEINIYPETIYQINDLLRTQPIIEGRLIVSEQVLVTELNPGNYTWYDNNNNIGFFQVTAGQTREFWFEIQ